MTIFLHYVEVYVSALIAAAYTSNGSAWHAGQCHGLAKDERARDAASGSALLNARCGRALALPQDPRLFHGILLHHIDCSLPALTLLYNVLMRLLAPSQYSVQALMLWHMLAAGLIVISLLLSYGLVEIPRFVWKTSEPEVRLRYCCHRQEVLSAPSLVQHAQYSLRSHSIGRASPAQCKCMLLSSPCCCSVADDSIMVHHHLM